MLVSIPKVWFRLISLGERIVHPKLSLVCGVQYFESSSVDRWPTPLSLSTVNDTRRLRCRDDDPSCPSVVHNNWIVSREAKTYRFKEHLLWMYDKGRLKLDGIHLNSHYDNGNVVEKGIYSLGANWKFELEAKTHYWTNVYENTYYFWSSICVALFRFCRMEIMYAEYENKLYAELS